MLSGGFANLCLWLSNRRNNKEKNQPWKASLPEAGRHPSNPVVERSWDAVKTSYARLASELKSIKLLNISEISIIFASQSYE